MTKSKMYIVILEQTANSTKYIGWAKFTKKMQKTLELKAMNRFPLLSILLGLDK